MSSAAQRLIPFSQFERLRSGREIIRQEAEALLDLVKRLDTGFCLAVQTLLDCPGSVIVCGMGKAGLIGQKITATLSSTGTRSHFLHPAEAVHGDLGCLHANDVLLALSNSGETEELLQILATVKEIGAKIVSITGSEQNSLALRSDVVIEIGRLREACPWGLAPSTTTTAMLAVGDALALVVAQARGFSPAHFARFHPGGSLGQKLKPVTEIMRPREQLRIASVHASVREVITGTARPGRRTGAVLLVDDDQALAGIFTDSDLARLLETRRDNGLDEPIGHVMTANPLTVRAGAVLADVIDLLAERKISELPVVNEDRQPIGLIDITDVIGWLPKESGE
ncbi:KpsF/GutQ family sugar-phosphate isomerase [Planctomicrobium piriforme]|uniref:Arabinose-5-phosphate isomerase n=1 Tax=Planctomicrobium piriforme TaxID=1576369 RepID=A0A1I3D1U6_9PLAN|nr:KpsF/GutQ family sugar-phosphate isomerase [Planctomicrobium piriforme]SFH80675.1 arabinose-5-phosphate isomerase [Planctomicrobium piriforme]